MGKLNEANINYQDAQKSLEYNPISGYYLEKTMAI
jgi:hypothetical protein